MLGFFRFSAVRRAESALARRSLKSAEDCYGLLSPGSSVETHELYEAMKFLAGSSSQRRSALKDERFGELLNQVDSRIPVLNSSYIGNFALRLAPIVLTANKVETEESANAVKAKELVSRLAETILQKGGQPREIAQVAHAAAAVGIDSDAIYEFAKHQMTIQIESATPDSLNLALQTAYKRGSRDRIYYALLCEKLCELTDLFTAMDVMHSLRALAKTSLLKGFLLRRLSTLIMDNLDQFTPEQLSEATYRLAQLKFLTPQNFLRMFGTIQPKLEDLSDQLKLQLLAAGCLCQSGNTEELNKMLSSLAFNGSWDMSGLIDYIYASAYLGSHGEELQKVLDELAQRKPILTRKYALMLKESLDTLEVESAPVKVNLNMKWKDALSTFEKTEIELTQTAPAFQEVKKILQGSSNNFVEYGQVGPFTVPFVDNDRKLCILIEFASNTSPLSMKRRCLEALQHRVGLVKYWEWRRLKTEVSLTHLGLTGITVIASRLHWQDTTAIGQMSFPVQGLSKPRRLELEYAFRQFDTRRKGGLTFLELKRLLKSIGVSLNRSELNFLQMEEDIRGMFILEDLFALCEAFYTDEMIKERLMRSLEAHFPGKNSANREQLKSLLCKLGRSLKVGPSEIDAFLNLYGGDNSKTEISFNNFVQMYTPAFLKPWSSRMEERLHGQNLYGTDGSHQERRNVIAEGETLVVCNWKCYTTSRVAKDQVYRFGNLKVPQNVKVITAPPDVFLGEMVKAYAECSSECIPCAQDVSAAPKNFGPFTGETTAGMLKDLGVNWTIIGHSERREQGDAGIAEDRRLINRKLLAALQNDLNVIVCIGEARGGDKKDVLEQIEETFRGIDDIDDRVLLAYEPSKSVGTDKPVAPEEANETIAFLKNHIGERFRRIKFLYGGSVNHSNAENYVRQAHIDGIMVGRMWQEDKFSETLNNLRNG